MLLNITELIKKHDLKITGIIQAGGHFGGEYISYKSNGITNVHIFEPAEDNFKMLQEVAPEAKLYKMAVGNFDGQSEMFMSKDNQGQCNSLLKPKTHLQHYPDIRFTDVEVVQVTRLDSMKFPDCNMLIADVQGAEGLVIEGAKETLKQIDYIYLEINKEELYENTVLLEDLKKMLPDFELVETGQWERGVWTDGLFVRRTLGTTECRWIDKESNTIRLEWADEKKERVIAVYDLVPKQFQPKPPFQYPADSIGFEEWFRDNYKGSHERIYLPIMWTSYWNTHDYGKDYKAIHELQLFINKLDRNQKYFTVIQHDEGLNGIDVSHLDIKVFAMSKKSDYPLPLICQPHTQTFDVQKDVFCSFVGKKTHPIRAQLADLSEYGFYIKTTEHPMPAYTFTLARSIFVLCPRGYGLSSFRICEAMQYGAIPVYISDEFIIPHNLDFNDYGVLIEYDGWSDLNRTVIDTLRAIPKEEITRKQARVKEAYKDYYIYEANLKLIQQNL